MFNAAILGALVIAMERGLKGSPAPGARKEVICRVYRVPKRLSRGRRRGCFNRAVAIDFKHAIVFNLKTTSGPGGTYDDPVKGLYLHTVSCSLKLSLSVHGWLQVG